MTKRVIDVNYTVTSRTVAAATGPATTNVTMPTPDVMRGRIVGLSDDGAFEMGVQLAILATGNEDALTKAAGGLFALIVNRLAAPQLALPAVARAARPRRRRTAKRRR